MSLSKEMSPEHPGKGDYHINHNHIDTQTYFTDPASFANNHILNVPLIITVSDSNIRIPNMNFQKLLSF